jgi:hypothetical protein
LPRGGLDTLPDPTSRSHLMLVGPATGARMPSRPSPSADLNAVIARVAPDVLALLEDGVPRTEAAIVAALADRHPKDDVRRTLMRLAVVGQLATRGSRYTLPAPKAEPAERRTTRSSRRRS